MRKNVVSLVIWGITLLLIIQPSAAAVTPYYNDLAGFNAAAGTPPVVENFDSIKAGTDISTWTNPAGITFDKGSATSADLIVIKAADSFSSPSGWVSGKGPTSANLLIATSGDNVLSPGGAELVPGPATGQVDLITITFNTPASSIGFDVLLQSLDANSGVGITVLDSNDNVLYSNDNIPTAGFSKTQGTWDAGSVFVGFVSDTENIKKVVITENDGDSRNPDCNIGLDTIRDGVIIDPPTPVPEFPTPFLPATLIAGLMMTVMYLNMTRK